MGGFSNVVELKVLDAIMGGTAYTVTSPTYIALTTVSVTESDTGSTITEATYTGYARLSVASSDWRAAATGQKRNLNALLFGTCTAGSSTVVGFAICSASSGGDVICFGSLASTTITVNITPQFATDALTLTLD